MCSSGFCLIDQYRCWTWDSTLLLAALTTANSCWAGFSPHAMPYLQRMEWTSAFRWILGYAPVFSILCTMYHSISGLMWIHSFTLEDCLAFIPGKIPCPLHQDAGRSILALKPEMIHGSCTNLSYSNNFDSCWIHFWTTPLKADPKPFWVPMNIQSMGGVHGKQLILNQRSKTFTP